MLSEDLRFSVSDVVAEGTALTLVRGVTRCSMQTGYGQNINGPALHQTDVRMCGFIALGSAVLIKVLD